MTEDFPMIQLIKLVSKGNSCMCKLNQSGAGWVEILAGVGVLRGKDISQKSAGLIYVVFGVHQKA